MYKHQIHDLIAKALKDMGIAEMLNFNVSYPPDSKLGDYTSNVALVAAKILKKPPMEIANAIKLKVVLRQAQDDKLGKGIIEKIEAVQPGFMNFYLKPEIAEKNLNVILKQKDKYGSAKIGKGKVVVIDYSQPNIAKRMHVGHLRSTIIGQAIYNIYALEGYKVKGVNHIGDWGTHFGKLIYAYKNFADKKALKENFAKEMNRLYVDFNARAKEDEELNDYARAETKKFQEGDRESVKIWKYFVRESLKEFNKIYKILGVKIDHTLGESFYQPMLNDIISEALEKRNIAIHSQGAVIIPLDKYNLPPLMIRKTDGATLYGTTDLAAMKYRVEKWKAEKIIYVVANEQAGHFQQLLKAGELMGYIKPGMAEHVKFGMVLGADGKKFSTREGKVILLEEVLGEAIGRARKIVEEKNPKLPDAEKKKIAKAVGIGAIKYNDLSQNRLTDISFNWDKMLDLRGNSAPYLQYTYARIKSILRKAKTAKTFKFKPELLKDTRESAVLRQLAIFDEIIERAGEERMPNILADYIYKLANNFNAFYENVQVLTVEKDLRAARLGLVSGAAIVIKNGLKLLGIETLERM
ncbi:MAG: arginine--tRNA ligase [bacterium]|nr:arginine--tRNA ligase [bacterium]